MFLRSNEKHSTRTEKKQIRLHAECEGVRLSSEWNYRKGMFLCGRV